MGNIRTHADLAAIICEVLPDDEKTFRTRNVLSEAAVVRGSTAWIRSGQYSS